MRITALVKSLDHVCCRYRVSALRPYLEAAGHELTIRACRRGWFNEVRLPRNLSPTDLILVQRKLLTAGQITKLRRLARWLVFDLDDAVFLRDSYAARGPYSERRWSGFVRMMRNADAVVAGNGFLRDQAALWTPAQRVHVVRTSVEPRRYPLAEHTRCDAGVQLAWIGSASTLRGLERIRPMLDALGRRGPSRALRVICDRPLPLKSLRVEFCPWSEDSEAADLAHADIGISWLPDDLWSQGKCGLKVLQYMAAGLPVVANPVGVQASFVEPGGTGFWADSPESWLEAIGQLVSDAALRRRLGQAGRRRVEQDFHVERGAALWLDVLHRLESASTVSLRKSA